MAKDKTPSLDELKNEAKSLTDEGPNLDDDDDVVIANEPEQSEDDAPEKEYNGPGVVIDAPIKKETVTRAIGPLGNKETQDGVEKSLRELDEQILEQHKKFLFFDTERHAVQYPRIVYVYGKIIDF
jgi:hypothetical protein